MKAKKIFSVVAALMLLQQAYAQQGAGKSFTINGTLHGAHVDSVLFFYEDAAGNYAHQKKPVVNNKFTITGNISQPGSGRVMFKKTGEVISPYDQYKRVREFYIEPGALKLSGDPADLKGLKLTGSKSEDENQELNSNIDPIREEMKPLEEKYTKANKEYMDAEKNKKPVSVLDSLKYIAAGLHDQFDPYDFRIKKITYQFFLDHPNSYVTLDMMRGYTANMSLDSAKRVYNAFNDKMKASSGGQEIAKNIKQIEAGSPGAMAPLFTKTDINGNPLSLSDFKGKYVMLDFWASWCVPCRKSNPHMIELYNKYKGKGFDVIGIADDDGRPEVWKAAVTKDNVGIWHNVMRGINMDMIMKHIPNPNDLDEQYGIASIPTKILIGPDGKILGRYGDSFGGSEEDMDKMLASIFDSKP